MQLTVGTENHWRPPFNFCTTHFILKDTLFSQLGLIANRFLPILLPAVTLLRDSMGNFNATVTRAFFDVRRDKFNVHATSATDDKRYDVHRPLGTDGVTLYVIARFRGVSVGRRVRARGALTHSAREVTREF